MTWNLALVLLGRRRQNTIPLRFDILLFLIKDRGKYFQTSIEFLGSGGILLQLLYSCLGFEQRSEVHRSHLWVSLKFCIISWLSLDIWLGPSQISSTRRGREQWLGRGVLTGIKAATNVQGREIYTGAKVIPADRSPAAWFTTSRIPSRVFLSLCWCLNHGNAQSHYLFSILCFWAAIRTEKFWGSHMFFSSEIPRLVLIIAVYWSTSGCCIWLHAFFHMRLRASTASLSS